MAERLSCVGMVENEFAVARTRRVNEIDDFIAGLSRVEAEHVMCQACAKYIGLRMDERFNIQWSKHTIKVPKNQAEAYDKVEGIYADLKSNAPRPGEYKTREEAIKAAHFYIKKWHLDMNWDAVRVIEVKSAEAV